MKQLIIIGTGGFAREVYWHAQGSIGYGASWEIKGFIDGDVKLEPEDYEKLSLPVLGDIDSYNIVPGDVFTCAIGTAKVRRKLVAKMLARGAEFISLIHETAIIHGNVSLGQGVIICPRVNIHDSAKIGDFAVLNVSTGVGHDVTVGDFADIMCSVNLNGNVTVGENAFLADGVSALPHAHIGRDAYVGARSLVLRRVHEGEKVFGIPAVPYKDL